MKRVPFFLVAAVLLLTGTASADLIVYDYLGNGEKVTLDTETDSYWYWNLVDFEDSTYVEQIADIADLNIAPPYGNIAGGWHMADHDEMTQLWEYPTADLMTAFAPTNPTQDGWAGRSSHDHPTFPAHYTPTIGLGTKYGIHSRAAFDSVSDSYLGAWVTSSSSVVPVPGALILAAFGLLTVGAKLRSRRR